jgi:hypothetical protein
VELAEGEIQILRGPTLTVTDRRVIHDAQELAVSALQAPQIETTRTAISAGPVLVTVAIVFFAIGVFTRTPMLWIAGLALAAFGFTAKINRAAFAVTVETAGARRPIYVTANEQDAKLALAAVVEAQRRASA